jgi:hypothetical protein
MGKRAYYSVRTGKNPHATGFNLAAFRDLFLSFYNNLEERGYFQEALGLHCVDRGWVPGTLGSDFDGLTLRTLRKSELLPVREWIGKYSEDDLFDVIEFLDDHCSQPVKKDAYYHSFNDCGWHFERFRSEPGRQYYRKEINPLLAEYSGGYELSAAGEILALPERGLEHLLDAGLPEVNRENVEERVAAACLKFRRYRSSPSDRRDAVRELADVLEFLRPKVKEVLTRKDESDLFQIANGFGIRHHNEGQKTAYNKAIWYSWMFYYYLATIHAVVHLIKDAEKTRGK